MNPNYIHLLYWNEFLIPKVTILLLFLILCKVSFKLLTKDLLPNGYEFYDFKISNRFFNWICVIIYIGIFILGISLLRIYRNSFMFDLKPIFILFKLLILNHEYLLICIICLIVICYLMILTTILKYIRNFLTLNLLRQHIVLRYKKEGYFAWTVPPYDRPNVYCLYREFIYWFNKINFNTLHSKIRNVFLPIGVYLEERSYIKLVKIKRHIVTFIISSFNIKYNILILPLLIIYDCYFHDFVIINLFKFLPYYFFYTLWYKLSLFWYDQTESITDEILYELYYCDPRIKYFRLDEDDTMRLGLYTRFGLQIPPGVPKGNEFYHIETGSHAMRIRHYCRYELIDEKKQIYYNEHKEDYEYG